MNMAQRAKIVHYDESDGRGVTVANGAANVNVTGSSVPDAQSIPTHLTTKIAGEDLANDVMKVRQTMPATTLTYSLASLFTTTAIAAGEYKSGIWVNVEGYRYISGFVAANVNIAGWNIYLRLSPATSSPVVGDIMAEVSGNTGNAAGEKHRALSNWGANGYPSANGATGKWAQLVVQDAGGGGTGGTIIDAKIICVP